MSHSVPKPRLAAICHASALMKRNAMNTSSSGRARDAVDTTEPRLESVRLRAHPTIGCARRAVRP